MEKLYKNTAVRFLVLVFLAVLMATVISNINRTIEASLYEDAGNTFEMVRKYTSGTVSFKDIDRLENQELIQNATVYSEIISQVSGMYGKQARGVKVVLTDEAYDKVYNVEMVVGSFFSEQTVKKGDTYAVISDQLANELFMTLEVQGNEIDVMGQKYIVSGVYKRNDSLLWSLSGDGYDRIYVPYTSVSGGKERAVDVLALAMKPDRGRLELEEALNKDLPQAMYAYDISEKSVSLTVFTQYYNLAIYIVGILATLFMLLFVSKYTMNTLRQVKINSYSMYLKDALSEGAGRIILNSGLILLFGAGTYLMFRLNKFEFYIAEKYLPADNIFDFKFYVDTIISDMQAAYARTGNVYSILELQMRNVFRVELLIVGLAGIFAAVAFLSLKQFIVINPKLNGIIYKALISIISGGFVGVCFSMLQGLDAFIPVLDWVVILYCFIAYCVYKTYEADKTDIIDKMASPVRERITYIP